MFSIRLICFVLTEQAEFCLDTAVDDSFVAVFACRSVASAVDARLLVACLVAFSFEDGLFGSV